MFRFPSYALLMRSTTGIFVGIFVWMAPRLRCGKIALRSERDSLNQLRWEVEVVSRTDRSPVESARRCQQR